MKHDMSYLKDLPIAVLGGGAVGKTCAADMKLAGREVRLYSRTPKAVANLDKTGILLDGVQRNLYGFERSGRAFLDLASNDMAEVVKGAGLIVIGITANAQEHYLRTLVPLLEDGQVVHIFTDNYATLLLRRFMREAGCTKKVIVGGWSSAPYGTRLEKIGGFTMPHVGAKYRAITLRGATQPMTDIDDFLESAKYLPCMDAVTHGDGPCARRYGAGYRLFQCQPGDPRSRLGAGCIEHGKLVVYLWQRPRQLFHVLSRAVPIHLPGAVPILSGGMCHCRCDWHPHPGLCLRVLLLPPQHIDAGVHGPWLRRRG